MNIVVLIKQVPDTEATIKVDGGKVDESGIKWIVNPYDEFALEEALQIKEELSKKGGSAKITAISVGPKRSIDALRTAYALGVDDVVFVNTEKADAYSTALIIKNILSNMEYDLVLTGKEGIDFNQGQTAIMVAEMLGIPHVNVVVNREFIDDSTVKLTSEVDGGQEIYEIKLPVVILAQKGLNEPRYPALKGIMQAKKKKIEEKSPADFGVNIDEDMVVDYYEFMLPPPRPEGRFIEGEDAQEKAQNLFKALREEIKVI